MLQMEQVLYDRIKAIMDSWEEEDIYAVSFFVSLNEANRYGGFTHVPQFFISYNTEGDCDFAPENAEKRWNYAFWRQNEHPVVDPDHPSPELEALFRWYRDQGLERIGQTDDSGYPQGYLELLQLAAKVARRFQVEGYLKRKFGRVIPIIVHDLEYGSDCLEATTTANPHGEADTFLSMEWAEEEEEDPQVAAFGAMVGNMLGGIWKKLQNLGLKDELTEDEEGPDLLEELFGEFFQEDQEDTELDEDPSEDL